jgi:hypothetical protein
MKYNIMPIYCEIEETLYRKFKVRLINRGEKMREVIERMVTEYVDGKKKK